MRLYLICPHCNNKVILNSNATTRQELAATWGDNFYLNCPIVSFKGIIVFIMYLRNQVQIMPLSEQF